MAILSASVRFWSSIFSSAVIDICIALTVKLMRVRGPYVHANTHPYRRVVPKPPRGVVAAEDILCVRPPGSSLAQIWKRAGLHHLFCTNCGEMGNGEMYKTKGTLMFRQIKTLLLRQIKTDKGRWSNTYSLQQQYLPVPPTPTPTRKAAITVMTATGPAGWRHASTARADV